MAGERAVVMVQNAGLLNSLGAFATMGLRYGLPFVVIVTNRGALADPNGYDIEKREAFDAGVRPMARVFDFDAGDLPDDLIPAAFKWAEAARKPVILALEKRLGRGGCGMSDPVNTSNLPSQKDAIAAALALYPTRPFAVSDIGFADGLAEGGRA